MITYEQVRGLAAQFRIHETVIFREYLQLVFLQKLYQKMAAQHIYFKGGTAIHLLYGASRFSEDLDFSVTLAPETFTAYIFTVLKRMENEEGVTWKEKDSLAGKQFLLTGPPGVLPHPTYITLDFSFREPVYSPEHSIIQTPYPVIFTSFVYHLSAEEILAEKIRAVMTRRKGRDLYDLWYLLSKGVSARSDLIRRKMEYYQLSEISAEDILARVATFPKKEFMFDLRPFVPQNERERLPEFLEYVQSYLKQALS